MKPDNDTNIQSPHLIAAVEGLTVALFALWVPVGFLNPILPGAISIKFVIAGLCTVLCAVSVYVICAYFHTHGRYRKWLPMAAIMPCTLMLAAGGMLATVILSGPNGPWGSAVEGIRGPLTNGLFPALPWQVSFLVGTTLAVALVYWLIWATPLFGKDK